MSAAEARRVARLLAGQAEAEFRAVALESLRRKHLSDDEEFDREQPCVFELVEQDRIRIRARIVRDLTQRLDFITNLESLAPARHNSRELAKLIEQIRSLTSSWQEFGRELIEQHAKDQTELMQFREEFQASEAAWGAMTCEYDVLLEALEHCGGDPTKLASTLVETRRRLKLATEEYAHRSQTVHATMEMQATQQVRINDKLFPEKPTLIQAGRRYLKLKRIGLGIGNKEYKYLKNRLFAFVRIVGNKPIDEYTLDDLTKFAQELQYVPANYSVKPRWRNKKITEIIAINKSSQMRDPSLTTKTIKVTYVGKIKTIFNYLCGQHNIRNPFAHSSPIFPKIASQSVIRKPCTPAFIATLFKGVTQIEPGKMLRSDDALLPLLGALTGARLGELVFLQPGDIKPSGGHYIADLISPVFTEDGSVRRPTKNDNTSLRYIALHDELIRIGFISWAHRQSKWLFPDLHAKIIKRPVDTASKRFQRIFKKAGIHSKRAMVFHSLRHFYKDWVRDCEVEERTIDMQTGHALLTVGRQYGSRVLRDKEVHKLATLRLPDEIQAALEFYKPNFFKMLDGDDR
jgi:integrase